MIAIVDYGMGNLGSVHKAFDYLQIKSFVTSDKEDLKKADKIVLPGVGAFSDAVTNLIKYDLRDTLIEEINNQKPFLGICLGLQMLFNDSEEGNQIEGLQVLDGSVLKFSADMGLKVPHIGWNSIKTDDKMPILQHFTGEYFYFVHSYYVSPTDKLPVATTNYGIDFVSAVEKDNILATQFHPEKSGKAGLRLLKKWAGA